MSWVWQRHARDAQPHALRDHHGAADAQPHTLRHDLELALQFVSSEPEPDSGLHERGLWLQLDGSEPHAGRDEREHLLKHYGAMPHAVHYNHGSVDPLPHRSRLVEF